MMLFYITLLYARALKVGYLYDNYIHSHISTILGIILMPFLILFPHRYYKIVIIICIVIYFIFFLCLSRYLNKMQENKNIKLLYSSKDESFWEKQYFSYRKIYLLIVFFSFSLLVIIGRHKFQ